MLPDSTRPVVERCVMSENFLGTVRTQNTILLQGAGIV